MLRRVTLRFCLGVWRGRKVRVVEKIEKSFQKIDSVFKESDKLIVMINVFSILKVLQ